MTPEDACLFMGGPADGTIMFRPRDEDATVFITRTEGGPLDAIATITKHLYRREEIELGRWAFRYVGVVEEAKK